MNIAIIGTGNVGGALAKKLAAAGHSICLGVRDIENFKGKGLLNKNISVQLVREAVAVSEVIILATPAKFTIEVTRSLGDTGEKIIIDAMNIVRGQGPEGFTTTTSAILANTSTRNVVKCFNVTGYNNMENPVYKEGAIDNFVAGDSEKGIQVAKILSRDIGFANCYEIGGNDTFFLMEQYALFWINLALFQGYGREIGFKLLKRR